MQGSHDIFRSILLLGFLVILPIGTYYRMKSQATGEKLDRRQEGLVLMVLLRVLGGVFFTAILAYLINPAWMEWSSLDLPNCLRWFGVGLGGLSGLLMVWAFDSLGKNLTDTVVTREQHELVVSGPYRWIRHPFYSCGFLTTVAVGLIAGNWFFPALGSLTFMLLVIRTRTEERNLIERFGDEYRRYMERTGPYIPRFW